MYDWGFNYTVSILANNFHICFPLSLGQRRDEIVSPYSIGHVISDHIIVLMCLAKRPACICVLEWAVSHKEHAFGHIKCVSRI